MVFNNGQYASRSCKINGKSNTELMHRVIMGAPKGIEVDHRDGNGLNNCISNLRLCDRPSNSKNCKKRSVHTSSIYKGVSWHKSHKQWRALIHVDGRILYLGYYLTEIDAAKAYNEASLKYHGEFSRLNIL